MRETAHSKWTNRYHVRLWPVISEKDSQEDGRGPAGQLLVYMHGGGGAPSMRWHKSRGLQMSDDIGHQAQWAARAEPEEGARLSFQYSRSDTTETSGFNEILWADSTYQLPCSFLFLPLHMLFALPEIPFPAHSSLWILFRMVRTGSEWWFGWSGSVSKHLCPPSAVRMFMKTRQALVIMKCLVYTSGSSHYTMSTQCLSCFSLSHSKSLGPGA